jgi:hypothetical protein
MSAQSLSNDELELRNVDEKLQWLRQREAECQDLPKKMAIEKQERDCTLPPCERLAEIKRMIAHEMDLITRSEAGNLQKAQTRSVLLLITLGIAITALVAWGLRLMNG